MVSMNLDLRILFQWKTLLHVLLLMTAYEMYENNIPRINISRHVSVRVVIENEISVSVLTKIIIEKYSP